MRRAGAVGRAAVADRTRAAVTIAALASALGACGEPMFETEQSAADLEITTLAQGLDTPWDLAWGPDGMIWVTERAGRVSRVDPATGAATLVGVVPDVHEVVESGLMGLAFHPDFANEPWVYLAHSYRDGGIFNRLVRIRYEGGAFGAPEVLLTGIPGNTVHDGSRLAFGPDGYLYMTVGDAGRSELAPDLESRAGKVYRLTPEGAPAPDNPFGSVIFSYGHRNPQGIVFHPTTGALYLSEHGPNDNDEVMIAERGGDHGWPQVRGFCDGDVPGETAYCGANEVVEPLSAWTPTVGIAGLDYYGADLVSEWTNSLLVTSLVGETLWMLKLSPAGDAVVAREAYFTGEFGRLRDVLVGPDGTVYVAVSNRDGRGSPAGVDDRILKVDRAPGGEGG